MKNILLTKVLAVGAIFGLLLFNFGCKDEPKIVVKIERFDRDLIALDTSNLAAGLENLSKKYPQMLPLFAGNVLRDPANALETPEQAVSNFVRSPQIRNLFDTVQLHYPNLDFLERDLGSMFSIYKKTFPEKPVPQVITMVSEFATDAFTAGDSLCGIGLDMFLGKDFSGYNPEIFPDFIKKQFVPEFIKIRLAKALAQNLVGDLPGKRLVDHMIFQGKILYLTDLLLPGVPDSLKMGYTREQMAGCDNNETEVWARILGQNLLYSTDFDKWRKMVTPSPNAPIVFEEAPGEVGSWVGWQIVKSWMARNSGATVQEMLKENDAQKFLEKAKYKPRKK